MRTVVAVLFFALVGTAGPAVAETWSANDRRGDVVATVLDLDDPGDDDCEVPSSHRVRRDARRDILRLTVDHTAEAVAVTLTMRQVGRELNTSYDVHLRTDRDAYVLNLYRTEPGADLQVFLSKEPDFPNPEDIEGCGFIVSTTSLPCEAVAAVADSETDQVTVALPRTCLRRPAWVRVAAEARGSKGNAVLADTWSRHGVRRHGFLPPFGPRVHADA